MSHKELCVALARADTEKEVIKILKKVGYWNDSSAWRYYGDNENNFGTIGNQQSKPDAALVEKIVNSVDAVLMRECLKRGIDPEGDESPESTKEALEKYFGIYHGNLSNLTLSKRRELANNICIIATGTLSHPSYAIIDKGEGQTPNRMPDTFLSLARSNKLRIPFVQGKFNMGGTGALQFCGENNLHLIISKRCPEIAKFEDADSNEYWGFTIIRRESPSEGMKNSIFKYLAPGRNVLRFKADYLPLMPGSYPDAYVGPLEWGSFLKLYDYQLTGLKTAVYFNLYYRLSLLLPNIALPTRLFERRKGYSDIRGTYQITMSGLSVRLDEDRRGNLEPGFPNSSSIQVLGQKMNLLIYAFKRGKRKNYSQSDGIVFTVNGQSHGFLPSTFFSRKRVGLSYLEDSILVIADCTDFDRRTQEDLFMNSRDRLRHGYLRNKIEDELEGLLNKHEGLRELKEKRRREEIEGKIGDSKPLLDTIEQIIKKSPTLSQLFIKGVKLPNPFDLRGVQKKEIFKGKKHPTYFELIKEHSKSKPKNCPRNKRFRVQFETDAENEYFTRQSHQGKLDIWADDKPIVYNSLNLWNGIAILFGELSSNINIDDIIHFECEVEDETLIDPFYNDFYVKVEEPQYETKMNVSNGIRKPPGKRTGDDRKSPSYLALPNMIEIRRNKWDMHGFDRESAIKVKDRGGNTGYDFFVNMDNIHLQTEIKGKTKLDPKLLEAQYKYGMVLIGLALLKEFENDNKDEENIYDNILVITRAISPFLLPMISSLGELSEEI